MKRLFSVLLAISMSLTMVSNIVFAYNFDQACTKSEECSLPGSHDGDCFAISESIDSEESQLQDSEVSQMASSNIEVHNMLNNEVTTSISTPKELLDLLSSNSTIYGQTYALMSDINIDTSDLKTSFSENSGSNIREFKGIYDG